MRLGNKTCLITGAARGIGLGCARYMAEHGAQVLMADIDIETARHEASAIAGASAFELDVACSESWRSLVEKIETAGVAVNVLVNNAGVCITGDVEALAEEDWDKTIDLDLKSVYLGCKLTMPLLARNSPASIINMASISSMIASANFAAYNAAKAGVHMLTKSVALHAARSRTGVRCNSVHPAFVDTAMIDAVVQSDSRDVATQKLARQIPLGRIATVEDVAWAVVYLASDESSFMTGAEIKLDGGISAM